jgi:hypothetical protein
MKREDRLAKATNPHIRACTASLCPVDALNVGLPEILQWKLPRETVQLASATEAAFISYPPDGFETP